VKDIDIVNNDEFVDKYSKEILAFAYNKTGNIYDAEDLSQEILISLFTSIPKYSKIENMDGFVYTICYHCWSNFLRKNKKHWNNTDIDDIIISDDCDVQTEVENAIFIEKMKKEIAYLSKLHRDIITMSYYDNKTSGQISKELNISDSTVRWHLVEIRKKLKGRIENMNNENLNYKPIKLNAGWSGRSGRTTRGIGQYRLVDNICWLCYGKPLTIEEIAQKLSVAAAFIEPHLEELVFMDDMKVVDGNKYQTNFFIRTRAFLDESAKYYINQIGSNIAIKEKFNKLYEEIEKRYDDIKAIDFAGSDLDKDFLLWALIPFLVRRLENKSNDIIKQKKEYFYCMPKRKDGGEHWIRAFLQEDEYVGTLSKEGEEFFEKYICSGWSDAWLPNEICSLQISSYATKQVCAGRDFLYGNSLQEISRIVEIIKNNLTPGEFDKRIIAKYEEMGYLKVEDGKIKILIPYFKKDEYDKLDKIFIEIENNLGDDFFVDCIEGYIKTMKSHIPEFLPDNERNYAASGDITFITAIPYYLADKNILRYPTDEEAKRLCIIIYEIK